MTDIRRRTLMFVGGVLPLGVADAANARDEALQARDAAALSAAQAALYDGIWFDDVAAVEADTELTYTAGQPGTVAVGDIAQTRAEGAAFEVVASPDPNPALAVQTAGGVNLRRNRGISSNVLDYIPRGLWKGIQDGTNTTDLTDYFNAALAAGYDYGAGITSSQVQFALEVPAGYYKVGAGSKSIYIRKGQHLRGAGMGATFFDLSGTTSNTAPIFFFGRKSDATVDPGGLAPEISGIFTYGGPAAQAVISALGVAGYAVHDFFMTSAGIGLDLGGGDGKVYNAIIDQGLTGIRLRGQNNDISNVRFYNMNFDVVVGTDCCDCSLDIQSEYNQYISIDIPAAATGIKNLMIPRHRAVYNAQYGTFVAAVRLGSSSADVKGGEWVYRNCPGAAVNNTEGFSSSLSIDSLHVDGLKTVAAYAQSTACRALAVTTAKTRIGRLVARNCGGQPVAVTGANACDLRIASGEFSGNTGGTVEVAITNTSGGRVDLENIRGDGARPLFGPQAVVDVRPRNCSDWWGAVQNDGTYDYILLPYQHSNVWQVTLRANPAPGGSANYRKSASVLIQKDNDYSSALSAARSYLNQTTAIAGAAHFNAALSLTAAFGSPTGGVEIASANSGQIAVYWPQGYASESLRVEQVI